MIGIIGVVVMILLIAARMWVGASLAIVGFVGIILMHGFGPAMGVVVTTPFAQLDNYVTTAIPMFTAMGMIIAFSTIGKEAFDTAYKFLSRTNGGMASATVAAAGLIGAVTGSDNVASVIMSKLALPELKRLKCDDSLATASVAAASPVAILLPPSMAFIMYGMLTETSVAALFMAGIVPGILVLIGYIIAINITVRFKPHLCPKGESFSWKVRFKSLWGIAPIVVLFLLVLGSIYAGIATPTEAGAIGTFGAFIIALIKRDINRKNIVMILRETVLSVGFVVFMLVGTFIFIRFIALSRLPFLVSNFILGLDVSVGVIMLAVAIMYFVIGAVIPQIPLMILTVPILAPAMAALGIDLVWFGVFVVIMMGLAAVTPPLGMNVFIVSGLSRVPVSTVYKGILPFVISDIVVILIVAFFPIIVLWLPTLML